MQLWRVRCSFIHIDRRSNDGWRVLLGCGGGVGYITVVVSAGTYTEVLSFGLLLASATLEASDYGSIPINPGVGNVSVIINSVGWIVDNDSMTLQLLGTIARSV